MLDDIASFQSQLTSLQQDLATLQSKFNVEHEAHRLSLADVETLTAACEEKEQALKQANGNFATDQHDMCEHVAKGCITHRAISSLLETISDAELTIEQFKVDHQQLLNLLDVSDMIMTCATIPASVACVLGGNQ